MAWIIVSALAFALIALVAGNNLVVASGAIISGRMVRKHTGILICAAGYIVGLVLESGLLERSLNALLPIQSPELVSIALVVSILVFVIGQKLRAPQSLSITFTMALFGIALAGAAGEAADVGFAVLTVLFWVFGTLVAAVAAMLLMRKVALSMRKRRVWTALSRIKTALIILSFLSAMMLGANTMGLVYLSVKAYTPIWVIVAAVVAGSFLLSSGTLRRIGEQILPIRYLNAMVAQLVSVVVVEAATLASLPFSLSQAFTASIYGAGMGYRTRLILRREAVTIAVSWVFTAALSLALAYLLAMLL